MMKYLLKQVVNGVQMLTLMLVHNGFQMDLIFILM